MGANRETRREEKLSPPPVSRPPLVSRLRAKRRVRLAGLLKRLSCRAACLLFRNTYCRASVHIYNGDFGAISVREQSFTAPVLKSGSSNIGLFFAASLRRNRTANVAEVNKKERGLEPTVIRPSGSKASERSCRCYICADIALKNCIVTKKPLLKDNMWRTISFCFLCLHAAL